MLYSLRSTRVFDSRQVEREKVLLVLEAMVRSPSAGNEQNRNFYIFGEKAEVDGLENDTRAYYVRLAKKTANPAVRAIAARAMARRDYSKLVIRNRMVVDAPREERLQLFKEMLDEIGPNTRGGFRYFNNSTAAILVTSCTNTTDFHKAYHKGDVAIAVTYGALAAASLGLASCRMGLAEMALQGDGSLREKYGIPANERVDGFLALGYSPLKWKGVPPRGLVKVVWV